MYFNGDQNTDQNSFLALKIDNKKIKKFKIKIAQFLTEIAQ